MKKNRRSISWSTYDRSLPSRAPRISYQRTNCSERGEAPPYAVQVSAEDSDRFREVDRFFMAPRNAGERDAKMDRILLSLMQGDHSTATRLFDHLISNESLSSRKLGLTLRYLAKNGQYERAFDLLRTRALPMLPLVSDTACLLRDIKLAMDGTQRQPGQEPWRSNPRIKAQWPEIALSLHWFQYAVFDGGRTASFAEEIMRACR